MTKSSISVEEIDKLPIKSISDRGVSLETAQRYGVRTAVSEHDGKTPTHHYYPYTKNGERCGYKARALDRKRFFSCGVVDYHCDLFGMETCGGGRKVFVCEGEVDCMRLYEVLSQKAQEQGYGSRKPNVVSIGGAGWAVDHLANNKDFLNKFAEVVLVFDQDEAGFEAVKRVSHLFPYVKHATFSRNDVCDMKGREDELYKAVLFESKQYCPSGIISGSDISLEDLKKPKPKGLSLPFPKLEEKMRGLRDGELTVLIAPAKSGKTTVVSEIEYHLNKYHQQKIATIYLESGYEQAAKMQVAIDNNVPVDELTENPNLISDQEYQSSFENLIDNDRRMAVNHWGSLESADLLYKIRYLATVRGCRFIILDHISMVFSGQMTRDERKEIDWLLTQLAQLVVELNIHIITVAHISRGSGKNFYEGAVPTLSDARGSGAFEQLAFNVISVSRNHMAENPDKITIHLLANRVARRIGECDTCQYDQQTGRLKPLTEEF